MDYKIYLVIFLNIIGCHKSHDHSTNSNNNETDFRIN
jgi:hypothetical protein